MIISGDLLGLTQESAAFAEEPHAPAGLDAIVLDLQQLRLQAGQPSFAEIALRISRLRELDGMSPAASHIARSSVHSMFAMGRRRMNAELLSEIVLALGEDQATASEWRNRCLRAQSDPSPVSAPVPQVAANASSQLQPPLLFILAMLACIGLNYFGGTLNAKFQLPLFLDMIGTAIAAIVFGPWKGAAVGLVSNVLGAIAANPISMAFALVNIVGALVWGYGARAWGMRRPWWKFVLLSVIVAFACTMVAAPINVLLFGGVADGHFAYDVVNVLVASGEGIWRSVFSVNIGISIADKVISGCIALAIVAVFERRYRIRT